MRLLTVLLFVMFALPVWGQQERTQPRKELDTAKLGERLARGTKVKDPTDTLTVEDYKIISFAGRQFLRVNRLYVYAISEPLWDECHPFDLRSLIV